MLKKIVSILLITISSLFILKDIKDEKEYKEKIDKVIVENNINRNYDGYISFLGNKWLIKTGDYNEILNDNLVLMISDKKILTSKYGNIILAGHNNRYVFSKLYKLKVDDKVIVSDFNNNYVFKVFKLDKVNIKNIRVLDNIYDDKILTLITCTSDNQVRYIVRAKYIRS